MNIRKTRKNFLNNLLNFSPFHEILFLFGFLFRNGRLATSVLLNKDVTPGTPGTLHPTTRDCNLLISCRAYRCYPPDGYVVKRQNPHHAATTMFKFLFRRLFVRHSAMEVLMMIKQSLSSKIISTAAILINWRNTERRLTRTIIERRIII